METPTRSLTPDESAEPSPVAAPDPRPPRRWLGRAARGLLAALAVIFVLGGLTAASLLGVRSDLDRGRSELQIGRHALTAGDLTVAADAFGQAESSFDRGVRQLSGGLAATMRTIPFLGRNLDVADGAAIAGRELSSAGAQLTVALNTLPNGLGSLAPSHGRLPVEALRSLSDDVRTASLHAQSALAAIDATPSSLLVGPVADARFEAAHQVDDAASTLRAASLLFDALPAFAGADGPRNYLLVAESPAELRGTGGIWGAFAVLTMRDGTISVSAFHGVLSLPRLPRGSVPPPSEDYRRNYAGYGAPADWADLNMTSDFPSAARAALANFRIADGRELDGVISADPFALQELFRVTGPATIPDLGVELRASNVVRFTTNEAYIRFAEAGKARKEVLGDVVGAAFGTFLERGGESMAKLKALSHAVSQGHIKVFTVDPAFEQGLRAADIDGGLRAPAGNDLLSVVVNSRSGSKVDYYVTRTVDYDVQLGGQGQSFATTEVRLRNDAPSEDLPGFVINPAVPGYVSGDDVSLVTASCPGPCGLVSAQRNGAEVQMRVGSELGYPWYQGFFTIPAGDTGILRIVTSREGVWQGNSSGGSYRLTVLPQTTVKPTQMRITIHAPAGTRITWTSVPMEIDGGTAVWIGAPQGSTELEVRFGAPLPLRWLRDAGRLLP